MMINFSEINNKPKKLIYYNCKSRDSSNYTIDQASISLNARNNLFTKILTDIFFSWYSEKFECVFQLVF